MVVLGFGVTVVVVVGFGVVVVVVVVVGFGVTVLVAVVPPPELVPPVLVDPEVPVPPPVAVPPPPEVPPPVLPPPPELVPPPVLPPPAGSECGVIIGVPSAASWSPPTVAPGKVEASLAGPPSRVPSGNAKPAINTPMQPRLKTIRLMSTSCLIFMTLKTLLYVFYSSVHLFSRIAPS